MTRRTVSANELAALASVAIGQRRRMIAALAERINADHTPTSRDSAVAAAVLAQHLPPGETPPCRWGRRS